MIQIIASLPTPIELVKDPISLIVFGMYGGLMVWEGLFPARQLPRISWWKLRGITAFMVYFFLSSYLPMLWGTYLAAYQVFDLTWMGTAGGALAGILIYELGLYVWHRSLHRNSLLWKVFHQLHHSAERLDTYGAFYFSPMDMIGFTFLSSLCLVVVAGLTPGASTLILLGANFLAIFQHSNIRTPAWIGYFIQRPESHTVHHARGIHAYNYADLPLYDMLFGTFKNPAGYEHQTGFYEGASRKVKEMLLFKDISETQETTLKEEPYKKS